MVWLWCNMSTHKHKQLAGSTRVPYVSHGALAASTSMCNTCECTLRDSERTLHVIRKRALCVPHSRLLSTHDITLELYHIHLNLRLAQTSMHLWLWIMGKYVVEEKHVTRWSIGLSMALSLCLYCRPSFFCSGGSLKQCRWSCLQSLFWLSKLNFIVAAFHLFISGAID